MTEEYVTPKTLTVLDDEAYDQLTQLTMPMQEPIAGTLQGIAPVQSWNATPQLLPDLGQVDNKLLAAGGLSNTLFVSAATKELITAITVSIGTNGNWFVGAVDTGVPAEGTDPLKLLRPSGTYIVPAQAYDPATKQLTISAGGAFCVGQPNSVNIHQVITTTTNVIAIDPTTAVVGMDYEGNLVQLTTATDPLIGNYLAPIAYFDTVTGAHRPSKSIAELLYNLVSFDAYVEDLLEQLRAEAAALTLQLQQEAALAIQQAEAARDISVTSAEASAVSAVTSAKWAAESEDVPVLDELYSSLHYNAKAQVALVQAIEARDDAIQAAIAAGSALQWRGLWDASAGNFPVPTITPDEKPDYYKISVAGTMSNGSQADVTVGVGDLLFWDTVGDYWYELNVKVTPAEIGAVPAAAYTNWAQKGVGANVVGMLTWKKFGDRHVVFDASNGTTPAGLECDQRDPSIQWNTGYPTLMGFNGLYTYGVRVDSARVADSALGSYTKEQSDIRHPINVILSEGHDLNKVITAGNYRLQTPIVNGPSVNVEYGQLLVIRGGLGTITQIITGFTSDFLYWRAGNPVEVGGSGSWGPWRKIYHEGDKPTTAELGTYNSTEIDLLATGANFFVNSDHTKIPFNQRNFDGNWAALADGAYGLDRWMKYSATHKGFAVDEGEYLPNTPYTFDAIGVPRQTIVSPASGIWGIAVPFSSDKMNGQAGTILGTWQPEVESTKASSCMAHFVSGEHTTYLPMQTGLNAGHIVNVQLPQRMRGIPVITITGQGSVTALTAGTTVRIASNNSQSAFYLEKISTAQNLNIVGGAYKADASITKAEVGHWDVLN